MVAIVVVAVDSGTPSSCIAGTVHVFEDDVANSFQFFLEKLCICRNPWLLEHLVSASICTNCGELCKGKKYSL